MSDVVMHLVSHVSGGVEHALRQLERSECRRPTGRARPLSHVWCPLCPSEADSCVPFVFTRCSHGGLGQHHIGVVFRRHVFRCERCNVLRSRGVTLVTLKTGGGEFRGCCRLELACLVCHRVFVCLFVVFPQMRKSSSHGRFGVPRARVVESGW